MRRKAHVRRTRIRIRAKVVNYMYVRYSHVSWCSGGAAVSASHVSVFLEHR